MRGGQQTDGTNGCAVSVQNVDADIECEPGRDNRQMELCTDCELKEQRLQRSGGYSKPLLRYEVVAKISMRTIQSLTIRVKEVTIRDIYISPHAKEQEEGEVLEKIERMSRGKASIIGDVNARHKSWDRKANTRGTRVKK